MKARSKEENAAHAREQRAKKRNASVPPVPPCPHCMAKDQEIARLTARVGALVAAQALAVTPAHAPAPAKGKAHDDDASLYQRVMAEKVGRISTHSTGHTIGTIR
jgi:hypothetical protein